MTIGVTLLLLGSATLAYFSETETSVGNTFTVATFDLARSGKYSLPFQVYNVSPGWSGEEIEELISAGSASMYVYIIAENFTEPIEPPEPDNRVEVGALDFADIIHMEVYNSISPDGPWTMIYKGSLRDLDTRPIIILIDPDPHQGSFFRFNASLPTDLNDEDDIYEDTDGGIPSTEDTSSGVSPADKNEDDNAYQADGVMCDIVFVGIDSTLR